MASDAFTFDAAHKMASLTLRAIDSATLAAADQSPRAHLGASQIGKRCERALWMDFHWCTPARFDARMLRLFARGQREEDNLAALLRAAGVTVHQVDGTTGQQFNFKALGGHFGGSMDGACIGLPDAPKSWHVLEFKTANGKSFKKLQTEGVAKAKPEHWAQMQCYMLWTGMERALYVAVCKDNDELHLERVDFDAAAAQALLDKAQRIISAERPPERIGGPDWWECKFCPHYQACHGTEAPAVNCRTCAHSTPEPAGGWSCARHQQPQLTDAQQRSGCDAHRYNPHLLHWAQWVDANEQDNTVTYEYAGGRFTNGARPEGVSSAEIHAASDKKALTVCVQNPYVQALRRDFDAEIVG